MFLVSTITPDTKKDMIMMKMMVKMKTKENSNMNQNKNHNENENEHENENKKMMRRADNHISFLAVLAGCSCSSFKDSQSRKHRLAEVFRMMIGTGSDLDLYIIREQKPELVQTHAQQASFGDAILPCQSTQLCEQQVDSKRILF